MSSAFNIGMTNRYLADQTNLKKRPSNSGFESQPAKKLKEDHKSINIYSSGASDKPKNDFYMLSRIVNHLKTRHQKGMKHPMTLKDILAELAPLVVSPNTRTWLENEAMRKNEKVNVVTSTSSEAYYTYKPNLEVKGSSGLKRLLQDQVEGKCGGISIESLEEALPHCGKIIEKFQDYTDIIITENKKEFLFAKIPRMGDPIEETIQKLWRSCPLSSVSEDHMIGDLKKKGIRVPFSSYSKPIIKPEKKEKKKQFRSSQLMQNAHLAAGIINYD